MMRLGYATDACMTADALYEADMETASAMMLAVLKGKASAPEGLRWRQQAYSGLPTSRRADELEQFHAEQALIESRRVGGDVCQRCGARPGACEHPPVSGGRLVCH